VTFTAIVSGNGGNPTGTVQFNDSGTPLGSPVALTGGVATLTTSVLVMGGHWITASYAGDQSFAPSTTGQMPVRVQAATAATRTATVTTLAATVVGPVELREGSTTLGSAMLSGGTASIPISTSTWSASAHTVVAMFDGGTDGSLYFAPSSSSAVTVSILAV